MLYIRHPLQILLLAFAVCWQGLAFAAHPEHSDAGSTDDTECIECVLFQGSSAGAVDHAQGLELQPPAPLHVFGLYLQPIRHDFATARPRAPPA